MISERKMEDKQKANTDEINKEIKKERKKKNRKERK